MTEHASSYTGLMADARFDTGPTGTTPDVRYLICSSPRTGSNLLCDYLWQIGYGVPMEYLEPVAMRLLVGRWGSDSPRSYLLDLLTRRQVDGVFGAKAHYWQLAQSWGGREPIAFTHYVRLTREDRAAQVRSHARAKATRRWINLNGDPDYYEPDAREIGVAAGAIARDNAGWSAHLEGRAHLAVTYEQLVADPQATVDRVVAWLGLEPRPVGAPRLHKVSP